MNSTFHKNFIALQTLLTKETVRFLRIWSQTLLPSAITITLYFIIFGKLVGSQLRDIEGYTYMQYIVPGLTMMSILTNAYSNTSGSFFGTKFTKSIEELLVSPMPSYIILLGFMLGGTLRGLLVAVIVLGVSMFFTHLQIHSLFVVITMAVMSCMVFSLAGLINGIFAKKFDDISFVPTFVLAPLTYLGGVFYSIKQLPHFWQTLSIFNPVFDIVDTFKYGMLGISDQNVYIGFTLVTIMFVILFIWSLILLEKGTGTRT